MTAPGFAAVADAHPGRLAVVDADRPGLTYAELLSQVDRLAHALDAWEAPPAGVVTSVLPNRREYHELRLATGRTGRYFTPLSHHLRPPEISYLLADSGTPLCLVDRTTRGLVEEALALPEAPTGALVVEVGEEYESVLAGQPVGPPGRLEADREGVIDRVGARLRDVLAGPKLPREMHLVDDLPRSAARKLLRRDVRAAYDADVAARTAPSTRPEENR